MNGKAETKLPENFQKRAKIGGGFPGFNSRNGGMRKSAQLGKVSLGKIQIMALFNHCADNLGKCFNFIDISGNFRVCRPHMIFII